MSVENYHAKWQKFIERRLEEALVSEDYSFGRNLEPTLSEINGLPPAQEDSLPPMETLDAKKERILGQLTDLYLCPRNKEEYNVFSQLFFENFHEDSFEYLRFLNVVLVMNEKYITGNDETSDRIFSWLLYIQETEAKEPDFKKLPINSKTYLAQSTLWDDQIGKKGFYQNQVKWKHFIQIRMEELLLSQNYHSGERLGSAFDDMDKYSGKVEKLTPLEVLATKRNRVCNMLIEWFTSPTKDEYYNLLIHLYTENFNHDSFKYLQFLVNIYDVMAEEYWRTESLEEINDMTFAYLFYFKENELSDPDFESLPLSWKIQIAHSTSGGEKNGY